MYVMFPEKMTNYVYLSEKPIVDRIIEDMDDDSCVAMEYAEIAARCITHCNDIEILRVESEICRNCRTKDRYFEGSKDFDIWITFIALVSNGFNGIVMGGANLTDIWDISGHEETDEPIRRHMFIRKFEEVK